VDLAEELQYQKMRDNKARENEEEARERRKKELLGPGE